MKRFNFTFRVKYDRPEPYMINVPANSETEAWEAAYVLTPTDCTLELSDYEEIASTSRD